MILSLITLHSRQVIYEWPIVQLPVVRDIQLPSEANTRAATYVHHKAHK